MGEEKSRPHKGLRNFILLSRYKTRQHDQTVLFGLMKLVNVTFCPLFIFIFYHDRLGLIFSYFFPEILFFYWHKSVFFKNLRNSNQLEW